MMSEPTEDSDTVRVTDTPVNISKTVEKKPNGMVITYLLLSENDQQLAVRVRDDLPTAANMEEAGFHPEFEPESWDVQADEFIFEDVIPPGRGLDIVYGIVASPEQAIQTFLTKPAIESAQPLDPSDGADSASSVDGTMFRSSSLSNEEGDGSDGDSPNGRSAGESTESTDRSGEKGDDADPTPTEQSPESDSGGAPESGTGTSAFDGSEDDSDRTDGADRNEEEVKTTADDPFLSDTDQPGPVDATEETGEDAGDATNSRPSVPQDTGEEHEAPSGGENVRPPEGAMFGEDRLLSRDELEVGSPEAANQSTASSADSIAGPDSEGTVLDALLAELREKDPSDEGVEELANRLGLAPTRSKEVRLEKVESRVARMSAFADTVEDVVDEHGDLSTWMTDVSTQVSDVDERLGGIERELDGLEAVEEELRTRMSEIEDDLNGRIEGVEDQLDEELSDVRDAIDSNREHVEERLDLFDEDLERIESELESLESELDDRSTTFDSRLDGLEESLDSVQGSLDEDIATLQDDVTDLAEIRDVVADAFVEVVYDGSSIAPGNSGTDG